MKRISEVVHQLSFAQSLEEVIAIVRSAARKLTGADGATFILPDGDRCFYADEDAIGPLWKGKRFPMHSCVSGWAMQNRETAVIPDIYNDARVPVDAYRPTFVKSMVMVPIRQEQPVGAIGNYWSYSHAVTSEELALLQTLADCTSIAMQNVNLIFDLKKAKASLEAALRSRDEFLSIAAHEFRTPVSVLKLQLQLTERSLKKIPQDEPKLQEFSEGSRLALRQVESLGDLVEQLLDISTLHLDRLDLSYTTFDFSECVRSTVEQFAPIFLKSNCKVSLDLTEKAEGEWDRGRVIQMITNLLSNACKYAAGKPVQVSVKTDEHGFVSLSVNDRGPGIAKDLQLKLFNRFERGVDCKNHGGLGLGLFITKQLVDLHGGAIRFESGPSPGTQFIIDLPRQRISSRKKNQ